MKGLTLLLLACSALHCMAFHETFSGDWETRWIHSADDKYAGKFTVTQPIPGLEDDALTVPEKAKHYGISALLPDPVDPSKEPLVLQYDVKLGEGLSCGGAYLKFITADSTFTPSGLKDNTPYTVMFGPDKCGMTNKVHLILRHKSPKTGEIEEKHLESSVMVQDDKKTHTYTAILNPSDNTFQVLVDGKVEADGSLFEKFTPGINPPAEIPDADDKKPSDWVDEPKMADPNAVKPEDWDENAPLMIPDMDAEKPEGWLDDEPAMIDDPIAKKPTDWDDEEDGEWEAPQISNPKCADAPGCGAWTRPEKRNPEYKGKWSAPQIDNPAYKGPWSPRNIPNPDFYDDKTPLAHIGKVGGVAIEIWTMDSGFSFDNVVVTNSVEEAENIRIDSWAAKNEIETKIEEEEKAKEEEEAAEAAKSTGSGSGLADKVTEFIGVLFDSAVLAPVADKLQPVRDVLEGNPYLALALISALGAAILFPVVSALTGGSKDAVAEAKKKDVTGADDKPASAKKAAANGKKQEEEIEEEEEEEEKTVRRRARRD